MPDRHTQLTLGSLLANHYTGTELLRHSAPRESSPNRPRNQMPKDQIFIGITVAVLCAAGLCKDRWFLTRTKKGKRLIGWFGEEKAIWVLRGLFGLGMLFGLLMAMNVIRPVNW